MGSGFSGIWQSGSKDAASGGWGRPRLQAQSQSRRRCSAAVSPCSPGADVGGTGRETFATAAIVGNMSTAWRRTLSSVPRAAAGISPATGKVVGGAGPDRLSGNGAGPDTLRGKCQAIGRRSEATAVSIAYHIYVCTSTHTHIVHIYVYTYIHIYISMYVFGGLGATAGDERDGADSALEERRLAAAQRPASHE